MKDFVSKSRGVALIVVLAFVVLLSGIVTAIFLRTMAMRRAAHSSCTQSQAAELARSAAAIVVSSLRQEIVDGSTVETAGNCTLYIPKNNACVFPQRNGSWLDIPSLVRISSKTAVTPPGVDLVLASDASTTATSSNGRSISPTSWNRHYMVPRGTTSGSTIATPLASFTAPSWVYVTDEGPVTLTSPAATATGRYAFAVYNQGGLLDMNVAGYPSNAPVSVISKKGPLGFADVTRLGLSGSMVDNIVGWRNYATLQASGTSVKHLYSSAAGAAAYCQAALTNTTGFMSVGGSLYNTRTDQAFLSRQQLLLYRNQLAFSQSVLQHMGTFSRSVTAPSCFHSIRFRAGGSLRHYRDDGTSAEMAVEMGEPLLKSRFSLARLAWLTQPGAAPADPEAIRACFGISGVVDGAGSPALDYIGPSEAGANAIKSLADVAAESPPREPNFFELLKAGITAVGTGEALSDAQIMRIGMDIISKYRENSALFHSVGGLGYVFDFWSPPYNYAPLLDLFSAVDEPAVCAGKINPNGVHDMTLHALFSNAALDGTSSKTLTDTQALNLAVSLRSQLDASPIADNSGLVSALATMNNRQAALVALASVSNPRTWNLLIDIIAQTGGFPKNSTSLDSFAVQSERRYWLHVAIDRLTGKVVDQLWEPVYE